MHVSLKTMAVLAALMPAAVAAPASAQDVAFAAALIDNCRDDAHAFCRDVPPGGGRIAACLYGRMNDLSPACRETIRAANVLRACKQDYDHFCEGVPPGGGRIVACLSGARDQLSPACRDALGGRGISGLK